MVGAVPDDALQLINPNGTSGSTSRRGGGGFSRSASIFGCSFKSRTESEGKEQDCGANASRAQGKCHRLLAMR